MFPKIYIFSFLILFLSCKDKKKNINNVDSILPIEIGKPIENSKFFFTKILKKTNFKQLKINAKVDIQTNAMIPTLETTMYIENNKKIWLNVQALFLNMARGLATETGIRGYEKINKTYIDSDFTYINNLLNINFIDYNAFQNLLLGKTFIPVDTENYILTQNLTGYQLYSKNNIIIEKEDKISQYKITLQYSNDFDLMQVDLKNEDNQDQFQIKYGNWEEFQKLRLPKDVKIFIKGTKNSQIYIENTKFDDSKINTPFSVPENYTKAEIK